MGASPEMNESDFRRVKCAVEKEQGGVYIDYLWRGDNKNYELDGAKKFKLAFIPVDAENFLIF